MRGQKILKRVIWSLIAFLLFFVILGVLNPDLFLFVVNILWFIVFFVAITFIALGALTFIGRKKEAERIIDLFLEGSITVIDVTDFIKGLVQTFMQIVIDAFVIIIPYTGIVLAILIYFAILVAYKYIGRHNDVTWVTVLLAFFITTVAGVLTLPKKQTAASKRFPKLKQAFKNFRSKFIDSFEVVIFLLFLTIDSDSLYFLPKELNVPIEAQIGEYDLMVRGVNVTDHFGITFKVLAIALFLELLRRGIRICVVAFKYYNNPHLLLDESTTELKSRAEILKAVLRKTVKVSKDDFLIFASFTVFITFVFLLFPRLKLLALVSASIAGLLLDLVFTSRLREEKSDDMLSRIFHRMVNA